MTNKNILRLIMLGTTALVAAPQMAWAQADQAQAAEVEELVVTARAREETLMEAPLTVQAVTAKQIERNPASDIKSLTDMLPNVQTSPGGTGAMGSYNIRGIGGANSADVGVDQAVTVVLDGMPISRGSAAGAAFFDLANIQVLPGPQALYFGKNASGGVIAFASANPTSTFAAQAKAGYEFNARQKYIEAAVSGPLSDTLQARLAFRYDDSAGWLKNTAGPIINPYESDPNLKLQPGAIEKRLNGAETVAGRLTLVYRPTDNFTATFKGVLSNYLTDHLGPAGEIFACSPGFTKPHTFDLIDPYGDCGINGKTSLGAMNPLLAANFPYARNGAGYQESKSKLASLKMEYQADRFSITSVTGYFDAKNRGAGNHGNSAYDWFAATNGARDEQWSEEIRLNTKLDGPLNFIVGAYIDHQKRYGDTIGRGLIYGFLPPINTSTAIPGSTIPLPTAIGYWPQHRGETDTRSVFGQFTWNITETLTLDAGARYTKVEGEQTSRNAYIAPFYLTLLAGAGSGQFCNTLGLPLVSACLFVPPTESVSLDFEEDNVSPEATLSWRAAPNINLYATYKSGYKPGGISAPAVLLMSNLAQDLVFGAEKSKGGEIGVKSTLMNGDLSLIGSIYHYTFDGLQLNQFDSTTTSFFIRNAGEAVTRGAQVQATYQATPDLVLNGSIDYNDAYFSDYNNAACYNGQTFAQGCDVQVGTRFLQDLTGRALPAAPKWVILAGFSWEHPLTDGLTLGLDGDMKYSSDYLLSSNAGPRARQDAFVKLNARVRIIGGDGRWEAAFIGRNLTNEYTLTGVGAKPGTGNAQDGFTEELSGVTSRGRELGVQLSLRY